MLVSGSRDSAGDITLSRAGKPRRSVDLRRRNFLIRFCQGAGATLIPASLRGFPGRALFDHGSAPAPAEFHLQPHYRMQRPLDGALLKVQAGLDDFITEKYADQIAAIFAEWSESLFLAPGETQAIAKALSADFFGASLKPTESRVARSSQALQVHQNKFAKLATLSGDALLREWRSALSAFSKILTAKFQITSIQATGVGAASSAQLPSSLQIRVRYEIVGTSTDFFREQRVGNWEMTWEPSSAGEFRLRSWRVLDETQARSTSPVYVDIVAAALGSNSSYAAQMLHGTDYWRTVLDGAAASTSTATTESRSPTSTTTASTIFTSASPRACPTGSIATAATERSRTLRNRPAWAFWKTRRAPSSRTSTTTAVRT